MTFAMGGVVTVPEICCFVMILLPFVFLPPFTVTGAVVESGATGVVVSFAFVVRFFFAGTSGNVAEASVSFLLTLFEIGIDNSIHHS